MFVHFWETHACYMLFVLFCFLNMKTSTVATVQKQQCFYSTSTVVSRRQYVLTNDHGRQDGIIYRWLNSRALNSEPRFTWLTQLIFMQAYIITVHGWHGLSAHTYTVYIYSSLFHQSELSIWWMNRQKRSTVKQISGEVTMLWRMNVEKH